MCGIVGLYAKSADIDARLGELLGAMLLQMGERGPDSAGVAFYRGVGEGHKLVVRVADRARREQLAATAGERFAARVEERGAHLCFSVGDAAALCDWLVVECPAATVMSLGTRIEIYKEAVHPRDFAADYGLSSMAGSHALGHTRMATESAVTTLGSHPFSTGADLCLVHNGSLSNHNRLRRRLRRAGIDFQTDNDSEVAAGFLTHRLRRGDDLRAALEAALVELDGFYTFAVGTRDGFAVLRDPIACKPAVLAETDDWVAMASEYRAIAPLPGAAHAAVWEPAPATIYSWQREGVAA